MSLVLAGAQGAKLLPFWVHGLQETLCPWSPTLLRPLEVAYMVLGGEEEKRSQKLGSLGDPLLRSRVHRDIGQMPGLPGWFCVAVTSLASQNPSNPRPQTPCSTEIPKAQE